MTGILASGLGGLFPPLVRVAAAAFVFSWAPGELVRRFLWRGRRIPLEVRVPLAALLGLALFSVVTWACDLLGTSFATYVASLESSCLVLFGAFFVAGSRRGSGRGGSGNTPEPPAAPPREFAASVPRFAAAGLAGLGGLFFLLAPPVLTYQGDTYDHIGYIRAIGAEGRLAPVGVVAPRVGDPRPEEGRTAVLRDPRKGTLHALMAAACRLTDVDPVVLWRYVPVFLAPAAVLGSVAFVSALAPGAWLAALALVLCLMFQGGIGREFFGAIGYGQHLALVLFWLLLPLALDIARRPGAGVLAGVGLALAGGALIHVDAAVHAGLMLVSMLMFPRAFSVRWSRVALLAGVSVACLAPVLLWRLATSYGEANLMHLHPQGLLYFFQIGDPRFVVSPVELIKKNGLVFVVGMALVPLLLFCRRYRSHASMNLALSLPPLLIAFNPWLAPLVYDRVGYLLHRVVPNVPAFTTTAIIIGSAAAWGRAGGWSRKAAAALGIFLWARIFVVAAGSWAADARDIRWVRGEPRFGEAVEELLRFADRSMPGGSVVASDPVTAYTLTAYAPVRVVAVLNQHGNPNDPHVFARLSAARATVSQYTGLHETMNAIHDYNVGYVVVNGAYERSVTEYLADWDPAAAPAVRAKLESAPGVFERVFSSGAIAVYRVTAGAPVDPVWFPIGPRREEGALGRCAGTVGVPGTVVSGVRVEPDEVGGGEDLTITVRYRKDREMDSELPVELVVRFDDEPYLERTGSYPGDKYVRRFRERRQGAFHRHRIGHRPFAGLFTPDMWPLGWEFDETFGVRLPAALAESDYSIRLTLTHQPMAANYALRDLLFNRDSYTGPVCAELRVRRLVAR